MVCIKTSIKEMPRYCDECQWFGTRPHPMLGWVDLCELCGEQMVDGDWCWDGNGRPKACPLLEIDEVE